jgi:hypothetical protein
LQTGLGAALAYGGLFPLTHLGRGGEAFAFHRRQGAGLFLLATALAGACFGLVLLDMLMSFSSGGMLEGQVRSDRIGLPYLILGAVLLACAFVVLGLFVLGVRNVLRSRARALPVIGRAMVRWSWLYGCAVALWVVGALACLVASATVVFGMDDREATVHFLYTLRDPIPEPAFRVSAVPMALSSALHGEGFFAGMETGFPTDDDIWIGPEGEGSREMELLYFGACNIGASRPAWEARFPRARIVSVDRLFHPLEGWFYLVFQAPAEIGKP